MVAPVTTPPVNPLLRPQATSPVNQAANRQVAQAVLNRTPVASKSQNSSVTLASANSPPSSNLPRGSIVDKLV